MLRLRPYKKDDAETIMSWIKDEKVFYKWTAGILGVYIPTRQSTLHGVLVHSFRRYSARFPVISA